MACLACARYLQHLATSAKAGTETYGSFYASPRLFQVICKNKIR
jgi:hypothetical protein